MPKFYFGRCASRTCALQENPGIGAGRFGGDGQPAAIRRPGHRQSRVIQGADKVGPADGQVEPVNVKITGTAGNKSQRLPIRRPGKIRPERLGGGQIDRYAAVQVEQEQVIVLAAVKIGDTGQQLRVNGGKLGIKTISGAGWVGAGFPRPSAGINGLGKKLPAPGQIPGKGEGGSVRRKSEAPIGFHARDAEQALQADHRSTRS